MLKWFCYYLLALPCAAEADTSNAGPPWWWRNRNRNRGGKGRTIATTTTIVTTTGLPTTVVTPPVLDAESVHDVLINMASGGDDWKDDTGITTIEGIYRPHFQKMLRCQDDSQASCEECAAGDDCFNLSEEFVAGDGMSLTITKPIQWMRYLSIIHIECNSPRYSYWGVPTVYHFNIQQIRIDNLHDGALTLYWDGDEVHSSVTGIRVGTRDFASRVESNIFPVTHASEADGQWIDGWAEFTTSHSGGHEILIEFSVQGANPIAQIGRLALYEPSTFSTCMDSKVCLQELSSEEGLALRNSNRMQLSCLSGNLSEDSACVDWLQCLQGVSDDSDSHVHSIRTMLVAALVDTASATVPTPSEHICIDPTTEDPESWECDCYEEMLARCAAVQSTIQNYDEALCLRAQFCNHEPICQSWKDIACSGLDPYEAALLGLQLSQASHRDIVRSRFNLSSAAARHPGQVQQANATHKYGEAEESVLLTLSVDPDGGFIQQQHQETMLFQSRLDVQNNIVGDKHFDSSLTAKICR